MGVVSLDGFSTGLTIASSGRPINKAMAESAGKEISCPEGFISLLLQLSVSLLAVSSDVATERKHTSASPGMGCTKSRSWSSSSS